MYKTIVGLLFMLLIASPLAAEENQVERFGDWGKQCEQANDGKEICYLFQIASSKEDGKVVLRVRIGYKPGDDVPLIVVTVPLGTLLPAGTALMMEGVEPLKMPYLTCATEGCITAGTPLPAEMIEAMKEGEQATVRVATLGKQVVPLPISLKGFSKGLAAIKP